MSKVGLKTLVVRKYFFTWDFKKKEQWLNEMVDKGWILKKVGFIKYTFEECEPSTYTLRVEFTGGASGTKRFKDYSKFVEETGAKSIESLDGDWMYFKKHKCHGDFELFSDKNSYIKQFSYIQSRLIPFAIIFSWNLSRYFTEGILINGDYGDLAVVIINLGLVLFCIYGTVKLQLKKNKFRKDTSLFE